MGLSSTSDTILRYNTSTLDLNWTKSTIHGLNLRLRWMPETLEDVARHGDSCVMRSRDEGRLQDFSWYDTLY